MDRHNPDADDHFEVVDSKTFVRFGMKYLTTPGPKSGIESRNFFDLKEEIIKERIVEKPSFKTLVGIKSVFQYICKVNGEVFWRKLPCFCVHCSDMQWEKCLNKDIVGKLKVVIKPGDEF